MRLTLETHGINLFDIELHIGTRGLYVDLNVLQPAPPVGATEEAAMATTADLSGTRGGDYERQEGPVWEQDQHALVRTPGGHPLVHGFGFGEAKR